MSWADLEQARRQGRERALREDEGVVGCQRLELVGGRGEGQAGQLGDLGRELLGEFRMGVEAGADRRAALGQRQHARKRRLHPLGAQSHLRDIAREFLAEGDGRRVLQVGPADLDDGGERLGLRLERVVQVLQGGQQPVVDLARDRDVHRRGEHVVGGLAAIDVIVGVDRRLAAPLSAEQLVGQAGDHLVGVHVRLGARPRLPDHEGKFLVVLTGHHLGGGGGDGLGHLRVEGAEILVHQGGGLLHHPEGMDQGGRHLLGADLEILDRALGLRAPVAMGRNLDGAERVGLGPGGGRFGGAFERRHRGLLDGGVCGPT